jgi:hypothetical protein
MLCSDFLLSMSSEYMLCIDRLEGFLVFRLDGVYSYGQTLAPQALKFQITQSRMQDPAACPVRRRQSV